MKLNRGGRGRGNRARGIRGRGRNNWNNFNARPQNPRIWNQYNHPPFPQYFPPRNRFAPPFFNGPPPLHQRPPSPLPGTEEYRQRNIQETSELIKRHLNLDGATADDHYLLQTNTHSRNINEEQEAETIGSMANTSVPTMKKHKPPRRAKSPIGDFCDVDEIHNKIIKHISKLSHSKKINFVNQGLTGYDVAVQQLQIQKRLELSRALRDMSNRTTQDSADCAVINSIIPDIGIKIEDLPREVIARLSSTLGIELNQDDDEPSNIFSHENSQCFNEPFETDEISLSNVGSDYRKHESGYSGTNQRNFRNRRLSSVSPPLSEEKSPERQESGLFKGRRFSNSCSDEDDILDDILNTRNSSASEANSDSNISHPDLEDVFSPSTPKMFENEPTTPEKKPSNVDKSPSDLILSISESPTLNDSSKKDPVNLNEDRPSQKSSFPFIKLRPTKDLLQCADDCSWSSLDKDLQTTQEGIHVPSEIRNVISEDMNLLNSTSCVPQMHDLYDCGNRSQLKSTFNDSLEINNPQTQQQFVNDRIVNAGNSCLNVVSDLEESPVDVKPKFLEFRLNRSCLDQPLTKAEKNRLKRQRAAAKRAAKPKPQVKRISRKFKRKLRAQQNELLSKEENSALDDTPTKKQWRSAGEKKQLPNNLPTIDDSDENEMSRSHTSPVIPFAIFTENRIPKTCTSVSSQTSFDLMNEASITVVPKRLMDASCQCVEVNREVISAGCQTECEINEMRESKEKKKNMLSQISEIEQQICDLMKLRLSLYSELMDSDKIIDHPRKRKCDSNILNSSSKRSCRDEHSQTKVHSRSSQEKSIECRATTPSTDSRVSRDKTSRHKEIPATSSESHKPVTDKPSSISSHRSSRSKTKEKLKKDDSAKATDKPTKQSSAKKAGEKLDTSSDKVLDQEKQVKSKIKDNDDSSYCLDDLPLTTENVEKHSGKTADQSNGDRVPTVSKKGETDISNSKEEKEVVVDFKDWSGSILVIQVRGNKVLSGNDEGTFYFHDLKTGKLTKNVNLGKAAITSICFPNAKDSHSFYVGTFEGKLYSMNSRREKLMLTIDLEENPVQCMEMNWGFFFIGATNGNLIRFSIKKSKIEDTISISQDSILVIKAVQEGARRVLLVATRNSPVTVRDAMSGLLMRTMESTTIPTVYTLLFHDNKVYCGTSQENIIVYTFQNGELSSKYDEGKSSGVVCMKIVRNILFAGCYNGNIYAYNTKTNKFIATMVGPPGLFLSMAATEDKIILGTKTNHFKALSIPRSIKKEMT